MKKLLFIGCLILLTACQPTTATPAPASTPTTTPPPTSVPVTITPSPTSTPVFTPTPIPPFFIDEFDTGMSAWSSFLTSGSSMPQVNLNNGSLVLDFSSPLTWYYAIHNAHEYTDVHVDAQFNSSGDEPVSLGIICMYSEDKGWLEYNFSTDGTYSILLGQWLDQGIAQYSPIVNDSSEYLTPGRTDYEIGITCEAGTLWLYINGKLFRKLNVERYEMTEGKVGIAAAVFENVPVTASFEWLRVSKP